MSQACFSACLADVTGYLLKHLARDIPTIKKCFLGN